MGPITWTWEGLWSRCYSSDKEDMSVTIEVQLPDDLIPLLEHKARGAGLDREQYLRSIVSRDLTGVWKRS